MRASSAACGPSTAATMGCSTMASAASFCSSCWPAIVGRSAKAAKTSFITAARACGISARSSTRLRRKLSRLSVAHSSAAVRRLGLFRRFLPERWALALVLAVHRRAGWRAVRHRPSPIREMGGRGFADPAAYILFLAGASARSGATSCRTQRKIPAGIFRRAAAGAWHFHEADHRARRRGAARRRRLCGALSAAMAAACRPVHRLPAGVLDGVAQLVFRPCVRAVQLECGRFQSAGDAAVRLCSRLCAIW